jgi:BirA family biotin operon repressor/biotin-[acetyl-CoA-carboxylase] ligase
MIIRKLSNEIRNHEEIDSTNEEMNRLIMAEDLSEGTIISTAYQHAGKGHAGNSWQSERGQNLLFSILLKPDFLSHERAFHLSRIASLSLYDIIDNQCDGVQIKWPNDLLVGDKKIAGILIENMIVNQTISHSILGIGVNINQTTFELYHPAPTSLKIEKGCHIDMNSLLVEFRSSLERWYNILATGNERMIMETYNQRLYLMGVRAYYRSAAGKFKAFIRDVYPSGELVMESGKGDILTFGFKEVEYLGIIPPGHN